MARVKATGSNASARVCFIEPMYAMAVQKLPNGPDCLYEVKFDGYRCLTGRDTKGVTLWWRALADVIGLTLTKSEASVAAIAGNEDPLD
jgi:bifunctional non-homologous end joining protein LigD